jgi:hypothetical protein
VHAHGAAKAPKLERAKLRINASPPPDSSSAARERCRTNNYGYEREL